MGHNVLQIGDAPAPARAGKAVAGWQKSRTVAPIDVRRLDASGGDIVVDASACYDDLAKWRREVKWTAAAVEVRDDVVLAGDKAEHILFRWHLGTRNEVRISGGGGRWVIAWDSARLDIESVSELRLTQEQLPEHTLEQRTWTEGHDDQLHACLIVRTAAPIGTAGILTRITAK
jgi:hypothetical protein